MTSVEWHDRDEFLNFLRAVREEMPPPTPLRAVAAVAKERLEERAKRGLHTGIDTAWALTVEERQVAALYHDLRALEIKRAQIFTKAASRADAPTIPLAGTLGLRNPMTGAHERLETRGIGREQFRRWHARQMKLFATEQEKARWGDRVSSFWEANPELPTLEAVCAAAGIPFESAFAAEMA